MRALLAFLVYAGAALAPLAAQVTSIPAATGTGGGGTKLLYTHIAAVKCQQSVPGAAFNVPDVNFPTPTCVLSGTTYTGTLTFPIAAAKNFQDSIDLPDDWTGAIDLRYEFYSIDTTAATATLTSVCVAGAAIANPAFANSQATTLTPGAASIRTVALQATVALGTCAAGNRLYYKISIDPTLKANPLELIAIRWTVRRTF